MIAFLWRRVLSTSAENRRLTDANTRLMVALRMANDTAEQAVTRVQQLERDNTLLVMMARDPRSAASVIATAHDIDRLGDA